MIARPFRDRADAGRRLAGLLAEYAGGADVLVLALPRGGVPVGAEVARELGVSLDVLVVRKLGVPGYEELAMGAVASGGVRVLNAPTIDALQIPGPMLEEAVEREIRELERRERSYRGGRPAPEVRGRTVIVVDDGLATGSTMEAAVEALRRQGAARIVVAVPVAPPEACEALKRRADAVVCDRMPEAFGAVGRWYEDFSQTTDEEVRSLLEGGRRDMEWEREEWRVRVPADSVILDGDLTMPEEARGIVLFAHGSGSGRHSPRNRRVARALNEAKLATLLIDLLTPDEEEVDEVTAQLRFDIDLLARRLTGAADWLSLGPRTRRLKLGLFGASTGAAAALVTAAERPEAVAAVVSRGGRPDLAGGALEKVRAPTRLIVGGADRAVIELNRNAFERLRGEKDVRIVPGATHLFEEPGALEEVARLAREWFDRHLGTNETV